MSEGTWTGVERRRHVQAVSVRITFRTAVLVVASVLAVVILEGMFVAAHRVLGWAAACAAAAAFISPVATFLGRFVPRVLAVIATFLIVGAAVVGVVFASVDNLDREVDRLQRTAPAATERLESRDDELGEAMRDLQLTDRVQAFLDGLDDRVGSGTGTLRQTAPSAPVYVVNAVLTIFLLIYGPPIVAGAIARVDGVERRIVARSTLEDALRRARRTVAALVAQGVVVGLAAWGAAVAYDLPAPIVLGLVAGVVAMLPDFGILLGLLPMLALLAGTESVAAAAVVLAVAAVVQGAEALWLRSHVDRFGVAIGPAIVWIVALLAFTVYGVGGAVVAVVYAIFAVGILDQVPAARQALTIVRSGGRD